MKKHLLIPAALWGLSACAGAGPRREIRLSSEPSIERALDIINSTPQGRPLLKFLYKNPVRFEYSNTPGLCDKFSLKTRKIFLPPDYKGSDLILALTIARAGHIYRLHALSGMDEIISEQEELGALFQARLALELNPVNADFEKAVGAPEIKNAFCAYVLENSGYAMERARRRALSNDASCQRPRETLESQRVWVERTRRAINDETFYQLLYDRDMARVGKGAMTMSDAVGNDAALRGLPTYETYRFQRAFHDTQVNVFARFRKIYSGEIREDAAWRAEHQPDIDRAREEFSACNPL